MRFTPQMVEHEHQTSFARSLKPLRVPATETPRRLLTSSALSSLLPIAAATGIVRRNYNTPNISFYSLSGNLIQLERISVPGKSAYDFYGSLSITTSYYNKHAALAPLPAHPKYRHDYQRYEGPQIDSHKSLIMSNSSVAGCGGVVTNNSSKCQTEAARVPHKTTSRCKHQRIRSTIHDLISRINIDKARILTLATPSSAWRGKNGRMINDRNASACTCIRANKFQKKKLVYLLPVSAAGQLDD
ncbi:hypothetical protein BKA66DRAFT_476185 [Pyrenochaeta sp. MPI-SDFR-AT-0127]|nr:hypothetical protein BKA66DRAFT_476185 [Pyrenochaeta sp. MPI-SDFR-AT-0127]